jgi:hypothetical protein
VLTNKDKNYVASQTTHDWEVKSVVLAGAWGGRTVRLRFRAELDYNRVTSFVIDTMSLVATCN